MIDIITFFYPSTPITKKNLFNKLKAYSIARFLTRHFANYFLPAAYRLEHIFIRKHRIEHKNTQKNLIVSLTSFPGRIEKTWLAIETILRQTIKPEIIILWLSKDQFPEPKRLPQMLLEQQKRGLKIVFCEGDIRSHKKYFYTLKNYPNHDFITIDDDFFYPSKMIENLLKNSHGNNIIAHRAYSIKFNHSGEIAEYSKWKLLPDTHKSGLSLFATSGGGTLFPSGSLHQDTLNSDVFLSLCPLADDIWLYLSAVASGTQTTKSDFKSMFIPILNKNNETLSSENVSNRMNDKQMSDLLTYYKEKRNIDIESKISPRELSNS